MMVEAVPLSSSMPPGMTTVLPIDGDWTIATAVGLRALLEDRLSRARGPLAFDLARVGRIDTVGAWVLLSAARKAARRTGGQVPLANLRKETEQLMRAVVATPEPSVPAAPRRRFIEIVEHVGRATVEVITDAYQLIGFLGLVVVQFGRLLLDPRRLRMTAFVSHLEQTGLNALPIIGLLSFLIGVVLAYQGATQLRPFGAEIFTVNLLAVSILRELGILITAIIVAGRSGSAFTAQIGTMAVNQEVDAMRIIGVDPLDTLVMPRVMALVVALPLLNIFANLMGLAGGAVMCGVLLDIQFAQFLTQLQGAVDQTQFWVGFVKAPVFAFVIALVGCFEGLRVSGSAESVGRLTTQSVVMSIFLVIVLDALFSIAFGILGY